MSEFQNYGFWNRPTQTFKLGELTHLVMKPGDIKSPLEDSCQVVLTTSVILFSPEEATCLSGICQIVLASVIWLGLTAEITLQLSS
jgi:hypothetical protein